MTTMMLVDSLPSVGKSEDNLENIDKESPGFWRNKFLIFSSFFGILLFIFVATIFPFKDKLYQTLYPKKQSKAAEVTIARSTSPKYRGYIVEFKNEPVATYKKSKEDLGLKATDVQSSITSYQNTLTLEHDNAKKDILVKLGKKTISYQGQSITTDSIIAFREYKDAFNGIALDISDSQAVLLKSSAYVKNVYPNNEVKALLPESVPMINADKVWAKKDAQGKYITGQGANIAILDTGVDYTHPDLGSSQIFERSFIFSPNTDIPNITSNQQFAVDGNRMAWVNLSVTLGNQTMLGIYRFGDPAMQTLILSRPVNLMVKRIALKDNLLVYYGATQIQSETGLYLYDLNTKSNRLLVSTPIIGNISISNGKVIYLRATSQNVSGSVGIYVYDINTNSETLLETGGFGGLFDPYVSNNLVAYNKIGSPNQVVIYDLNTQTNRIISLSSGGIVKDFRGDQILTYSCSITGECYFYLNNIMTGSSTKISPPGIVGISSSTTTKDVNTSSYAVSIYYQEQGSIQDGMIYFTRSPDHNRVMVYDQIKNRYVQINILSTSGAIAAEGKTICFRSSDQRIHCHMYDPSYDYPVPASVFNNKVINGYNFIDNNNNPLDDYGHGTHVSAIVAGNGSLKGVAPGANLISYKVLNSYGSGSFATVMSAIDKAVSTRLDSDNTNDIQIINMSIGADCAGIYDTTCGPDDPLSRSVDNAVDAGITAVVAAGNNGPGYRTINSPGTSRKAITVGAVDKNKKIADFSSRGSVVVGTEVINKPDIAAPGVSICAAEWDNWYSQYRCKDDKHISMQGTSMATPHVAGVAALLKQTCPNCTPQQIKDAIKSTAQNLGYDINTQGSGLVDALASVNKFLPICTPYIDKNIVTSWWKMDEATWSGKIAEVKDSIGTNHGKAISGANITNGIFANAGSFNGTTQSVQIPYLSTLTPSKISVSFWINPGKATTNTSFMGIIQGAGGGGYLSGYRFIDYNNLLQWQINFGSSDNKPSTLVGSTLPVGGWTHIVGTYDGAVANLYQNGKLVRSTPETRAIKWGITGDMLIGNAQFGFDGLIDDVRLYSRAITTSEVISLFNAGATCIPAAPLPTPVPVSSPIPKATPLPTPRYNL